MAGDGGRQSRPLKRSVRDELFDHASEFSFAQAVHLLERMREDATPPGEGVSPRRELALFRHAVRLDRPDSDIEELTPALDDQPPVMTVNVLGLTGTEGPLPQHVTERVVERAFRGDRAWRDFLDIFNHRLISLLYRARKKYRPALDARGPHRGRVASVLYAILGLGTPHLRNRLGIDDRALLPYAGLFAENTRSTIGLERIVEDCFGVRATVVPFRGQWHTLEDDDRTHLGVTGQNQLLGRGAVLGRSIWDEAAGFELRLGPLSLPQFLSFLPGGHAYRSLAAVVRFYIREELGFTIRPVLRKDAVPRLRISRHGHASLGRTSWLHRTPHKLGNARKLGPALRLGDNTRLTRDTSDDTQVRLVARR
ncbi:MAG: type VI secretion system baseplate subunit TssG [Acidobacteria bacterium]|nr:type VI secretion system baseplate subunit TssG [Acidobacteriota bacterium]